MNSISKPHELQISVASGDESTRSEVNAVTLSALRCLRRGLEKIAVHDLKTVQIEQDQPLGLSKTIAGEIL